MGNSDEESGVEEIALATTPCGRDALPATGRCEAVYHDVTNTCGIMDDVNRVPAGDGTLQQSADCPIGRTLRQRNRQPEIMDDPHLDRESHLAALCGLRRINRISGSQRILARALFPLARRLGRPLRVLDIATGGGDIAVGLAVRAARLSLPIELHGCDVSERALSFARAHAAARGVSGIEFFPLDALVDPLPDGYDILMCSLFLHHLSETHAEELLQRMGAAARHAVLVNDLRRTRLGHLLARAACRTLTRSQVVHVDGPLSVEAAFRIDEVLELARRAGLSGARVERCWPQRFLLSWSRS